MREAKIFAERAKVRSSDKPLRKYFLVYEGRKTEYKYFNAVIDLRQEIGINPIIELIPLVRSHSEEGWSNPKKLIDRIIKELKTDSSKKIDYETLLNRIMDSMSFS